MKKFMSTPPNQASSYKESDIMKEKKVTCNCSDAPASTCNQSLITGLGCGLAISLIWALVATTRPIWLLNLKNKLIDATLAKIYSKDCSPESGINPSELDTPAAKMNSKDCSPESGINPSELATPAAQEPTGKNSLRIPQSRPRARVCPYRRTENQLRRQIKQETVRDLRRLIKLAKLEAQVEVETEVRAEAEAQIQTDLSYLFTDL